jgi:hypothetical protein
MATPSVRTPRTPNASTARQTPTPPKKDNGKTLQVELTSIKADTSFYTRADGTEMERQSGSGYCAQIDANVIVTRSCYDKDGNEKTPLEDHHIGGTFSAIVTKVLSKDGTGYVFFAEVSLSRGNATEESVNLYDSI